MFKFSCTNCLCVYVSEFFYLQSHLHCHWMTLSSTNYIEILFALKLNSQVSDFLQVHFQAMLNLLIKLENTINKLFSKFQFFILILIA